MSGLDGINSLHKMLGALQGNETSNVGGAAAVSSVTQAKTAGTAAAASGVGPGRNVDSASFSAGGLAAQASDTSDVRLTKVAELRQAIASGSYNVPASAVADKMVDSLLN
jgi:flagellar biosynthesis anti-sigma factor FlgM